MRARCHLRIAFADGGDRSDPGGTPYSDLWCTVSYQPDRLPAANKYTWRRRPKGVSYSGFQGIKELGFNELKHMKGFRNRSFRYSEKAQGWDLGEQPLSIKLC